MHYSSESGKITHTPSRYMSATSIDRSPYPDSAATNQTLSSPTGPETSERDPEPISSRLPKVPYEDSFTDTLTRDGPFLRCETADLESPPNRTDIPTADISHRDLSADEGQLAPFQPDSQVSEAKIDAARIGD